MKKLNFLVIFLLVFIIPVSVFAKKIGIPDTSITNIKVPEDWNLVTKENINDMISLLNFDETKKANYKYSWIKNSYYADIVSKEADREITITKKVSDLEIEDLSIYPNDTIEKSFDYIKKYYDERDAKISLYTTSKGIKYYKVEYIEDDQNLIDYITTIHGSLYQYKYKNYNEEAKSDISLVESVIESIEYENYIDFINNNMIVKETEKESKPILIVIILVIIIVVAVIAYILINKRKNNKNNNSYTNVQVYNPVQNPLSTNPAVADFINQNSSTSDFVTNNNDQNKK